MVLGDWTGACPKFSTDSRQSSRAYRAGLTMVVVFAPPGMLDSIHSLYCPNIDAKLDSIIRPGSLFFPNPIQSRVFDTIRRFKVEG